MMEDRGGCTIRENIDRRRIGDSFGSCVSFVQFSFLTPSNHNNVIRYVIYHVYEKKTIVERCFTRIKYCVVVIFVIRI